MTDRQPGLRTSDVARRVGCSVQQIRDLESDGVLPPVPRSASGHRRYTEEHVHVALAYRGFAAGIGPGEARALVRAARGGPEPVLLALLDAAHARLHTERRELALAREAASAITLEPVADARPSDAMGISELADALGVRTSTLRHWDAEGLVVPHRSAGGSRTYLPADVRDARIVHQLRRAGHGVGPLRALMPQLRGGRRWGDVLAALADRDAAVDARSRALVRATAALHAARLVDGAGRPPLTARPAGPSRTRGRPRG